MMTFGRLTQICLVLMIPAAQAGGGMSFGIDYGYTGENATTTTAAPSNGSSNSSGGGGSTTTFKGTFTVTLAGATKAKMEAGTKAGLATHFGVAASDVTVTATESRRLVEARKLAGTWGLAYTFSVPTANAAAVETKVETAKTNTAALTTSLKTSLAAQGLNTASMTVTGFTAVKTVTGGSTTAAPAASALVSGVAPTGPSFMLAAVVVAAFVGKF